MAPQTISIHDIAPDEVPSHFTKAAYYRQMIAEAIQRGLEPEPISEDLTILQRTTINLFQPMAGQVSTLSKKTGLPLSDVVTGLMLAGHPYVKEKIVVEAAEVPAPIRYDMNTSRPLQKQFFKGINTIMRRSHRNIALAEGSTGIGKGRAIIAAAIDAAMRGAGPVIIATPTVVLARALMDEYRNLCKSDPACSKTGIVPAIMPSWSEFIDERLLESSLDSFEESVPGIKKRVTTWIKAGGPSDLSVLVKRKSSKQANPVPVPVPTPSALSQSIINQGFDACWLSETLQELAPELPVDDFKLDGSPDPAESESSRSKGAALCLEYRRQARQAPVIICTHAMVGYTQKNKWIGTSIPRPATLIIDEAHLFEQNMASVHSDSLSFAGLAAALKRLDVHLIRKIEEEEAKDGNVVVLDPHKTEPTSVSQDDAPGSKKKPAKKGKKSAKEASEAIQKLCRAIVLDLFNKIGVDDEQFAGRGVVEYHLQGSGGCLDPVYHAQILKYLKNIAAQFKLIPSDADNRKDIKAYRAHTNKLIAIMSETQTKSHPTDDVDLDDDGDPSSLKDKDWQRQGQRVTLRFSPDRHYPSLVFGASNVGAFIGALWKNAKHGGAAVSATLTTRKWDGSGAIDSSYITRLLAIPPGRAETAQPVVSAWLTDTPTLFTPTRRSAQALCVPSQPSKRAGRDEWVTYQAKLAAWHGQIAVRSRMIANNAAGGTLVLCTSYKTVNELALRLTNDLKFNHDRLVRAEPGLPFARLDAAFRELYKAGIKPVLLGVGTAWTGIDFRDESVSDQMAHLDLLLTDMIITRLPINLNRTPTMQQRFDDSGFRAINMETQIMFKQGLGRLIRRENLVNRNLWLLDGRPAIPETLKVHGLAASIEAILKSYRHREFF
jgi:Rad3-related DNA helicase